MNSIIYILTPILLAIILNLLIFYFKWNKTDITEINPYLPPGYIIGIIWIIIFGFLGYTYNLLLNKNKKNTINSILILLMILFCLLYPFLTNKFNNDYISKFLNILTLVFSVLLGIIIFIESKYIFLFLIPLILWSLIVNISFLAKKR